MAVGDADRWGGKQAVAVVHQGWDSMHPQAERVWGHEAFTRNAAAAIRPPLLAPSVLSGSPSPSHQPVPILTHPAQSHAALAAGRQASASAPAAAQLLPLLLAG